MASQPISPPPAAAPDGRSGSSSSCSPPRSSARPFVLVLGVGGSSAALVTLLVALSLLLVLVGVGLFVMYLRMIGKCNLPCWPTRAARFSQSLVENPADASSRFGTQVTLAADEEESYLGGTAGTGQERSKLMESDNIDAERIGSSEPKIVFKH